MIHTIYVNADTEVATLKKVFRKKLMTGGAVIRLAEGLDGSGCWKIFERFAPEAVSHNLCSMVVRALYESPQTPADLQERLESLGLRNLKLGNT